MRLREKAVPLVLLGLGCGAVVLLALFTRTGGTAAAGTTSPPAVAGAVVLGFAVLGALMWVPAGIFLMLKGIEPAKGVEPRAGLFEIAGATGVLLLTLSGLDAAIRWADGPLSAHMAAFAAAQCAAAGYAWARLRAFPARFPKPLRNLVAGAAAYLLISPFMIATALVNTHYMKVLKLKPEQHPAVQELLSDVSATEMVGIFILGSAVAPLVEEIFFRGMLYGALRRRLPAIQAALVSGVIFASIHLEPGQFLPLFLLGVALALIYEHTGSLAAPVGLHAANNAVAFGALIAARLCPWGGG